jgi:hypothetical protein
VFALTLPTFGYSLLSTYGLQYSIQSSYFAPLLPFLFFAAVVGLQRLLNWSKRWTINSIAWKGALAALLFIASGSNYFFQAQGPLGRYFQPWRYILDAHAALGNELVRLIPTDAVVVAQNELLAHLSNRREIYEIPIPDYRHVDYLVADRTQTWYNVHRGFWEKVLATGYFEIVMQPDGYLIAKRKAPDHSLRMRFREQITLLGYSSVATDTLRGGMTFRPILLWQAEQPLAERYNILVQIQDKQGHVWAAEDREPQDGNAPTNQWETGKPVGDQYTLPLPPTLPPGDFQVTVAVHRAGSKGYLEAHDEEGSLLGTEAVVASVRIEKDKRSYLASQLWWIEQPLYVDMGEIRFLGYVPPRQTISPGELLQVGLYWRAREKPRGDYVVAVQLRDAAGRIALEHAARPANGTYPTTLWDAGEVLLDWHDFVLPQEIAVGEYQLFVVLQEEGSKRSLGETKISNLSITR